MIRRHPDSLAGDEAREFAARLEERYPPPDWSVTYDVEEAAADGEPAVRELLVLAKRTKGVLEQLVWIDVDEILDIGEMGGDWLEEVDVVLTSSAEELEGGGPVEEL
ncbi:MAG: hypothetical protein IBX62_09450 [Coriobacteriia bacterium]|nr:hypothetical protein [Coriobacteriia bacterium]